MCRVKLDIALLPGRILPGKHHDTGSKPPDFPAARRRFIREERGDGPRIGDCPMVVTHPASVARSGRAVDKFMSLGRAHSMLV